MNTEHFGKSTVEELIRKCPQLTESKVYEKFKSKIQTIWSDLLFHINSVVTEKCLLCKSWGEVKDVSDIIEVIKELDKNGHRYTNFDDLDVITRLYSLKNSNREQYISIYE